MKRYTGAKGGPDWIPFRGERIQIGSSSAHSNVHVTEVIGEQERAVRASRLRGKMKGVRVRRAVRSK